MRLSAVICLSLVLLNSLGCQKPRNHEEESTGRGPEPVSEVGAPLDLQSSAAALAKPCADHAGQPTHYEGSGACIGNMSKIIELPTAHVAFIYNSLRTDAHLCLSQGWSLSVDRTVSPTTGGYTITSGSGEKVFFPATGQTKLYSSDPLVSLNTLTTSAGFIETTRDGTKYTYGATYAGGKALTQVQDRHGNTVAITRGASGCISKMTTPIGETIVFTYTGNRLTKVTDNAQKAYTVTYDAAGNISKLTLPDTFSWRMEYLSAAGPLSKVTSPDGETVKYGYANGTRVLALLTNHFNWVTSFTYTAAAVTTSSQNNSVVETFVAGRLVEVAENTASTKITRDTDKRILTMTDPLGRLTRFAYAQLLSAGRVHAFPTSIIDPDGTKVQLLYDSDINVTQKLTSRGSNSQRVDQTWDPYGQLLSVTSNGKSILYERQNGNLTKVTDPYGKVIYTATYDSKGNVISTKNAFGLTQSFTWTNGLLTTDTDPFGRQVRYTWDAVGNLLSVLGPDGVTTSTAFDPVGVELSRTMTLGNMSMAMKNLMTRDPGGPPTKVETQQLVNGVRASRNVTTYGIGADAFRKLSNMVTGPSGVDIYTDKTVAGTYGKVINATPFPPVAP